MSAAPQPFSARQDPHAGIVLVGAGHSHLHLIKHLDTRKYPVTLVDPGAFWYSGSASAMLSGDLRARDGRIDPALTCRRRNIRLLRQRVMRVDTQQQRLLLGDGSEIRYAALSLTPGSRVQLPEQQMVGAEVWCVKPISRLMALQARLRHQFREGRHLQVLVAGAGASGIEVACALRQLARRHGMASGDKAGRLDIVLLHNGEGLLPSAPVRCRKWLDNHLQQHDIQLVANPRSEQTAEDIPATWLATADHVVLATGLRPNSDSLGLAEAGEQGLAVDRQLRVSGQQRVFAAGDGIDFAGQKLARIGVHGVRQGPILLHNLQASLAGQSLREYRPQQRALSILNLGGRQGIALYGQYWWAGRLAHLWKHWLDRRFLERHRA